LDLSGTAVVRAQAVGGASPAGSDKSGVVDVRQAIVSTAEGKQASAELQSQFAARKNELEALSKQIATRRDRLAGAQMLSEDERASLERQGQHLTTQYDRKSTDLNEDLQAEQNDVVERIGRKLMDVLQRCSNEKGYAALFDSSAQIRRFSTTPAILI
jgi:outer membrane protein